MDYRLRYLIHMFLFIVAIFAVGFIFVMLLDIKRNHTFTISFENLLITDYRVFLAIIVGIGVFLMIMSLFYIPLVVRPVTVEIGISSNEDYQQLLLNIDNYFDKKSTRQRIGSITEDQKIERIHNKNIYYGMNNKYLDWLVVPVKISMKDNTVIFSAPLNIMKEIKKLNILAIGE